MGNGVKTRIMDSALGRIIYNTLHCFINFVNFCITCEIPNFRFMNKPRAYHQFKGAAYCTCNDRILPYPHGYAKWQSCNC